MTSSKKNAKTKFAAVPEWWNDRESCPLFPYADGIFRLIESAHLMQYVVDERMAKLRTSFVLARAISFKICLALKSGTGRVCASRTLFFEIVCELVGLKAL